MSKKDSSMQEMIEDFKQYVDVSVSNSVKSAIEESEERLKKEIREVKEELQNEMRQGFEGVGDAIQGHQEQLDDHEGRITSLEAA